jgi:hypothetical protein
MHTVGAAVLTYTVPASYTAVIKSVDIVNLDTSTIDRATVWTQVPLGTAITFLSPLINPLPGLNFNLHWGGSLVVPALASIGAATTGTAGHRTFYSICGYLLTAT